jgi:hypothetical protein
MKFGHPTSMAFHHKPKKQFREVNPYRSRLAPSANNRQLAGHSVGRRQLGARGRETDAVLRIQEGVS